MKKIYLSGPMRGFPDWNKKAFDEAEARWSNDGWQVFNPHKLGNALGYVEEDYSKLDGSARRRHLEHVMLGDIAAVYAADAVAVLRLWEGSRGATVEVALAQFLGTPICDAMTMQEIHPVEAPWFTHVTRAGGSREVIVSTT